MRTLIKLAWRNIWRNKRRSLISIASVLFAVLFAISGDSFQRGTYELMIKNMVQYSTGYLQIQDVLYEEEPSIDHSLHYHDTLRSKLQAMQDEIDYTVPRLSNFALSATEEQTRSAMVMGIDPERENRFNKLSDKVIRGDYLSQDDESVMLSEGMAAILDLSLGDTLILLSQGFHGATASGMYPVKGIVSLSVPEMNNSTVYMSLKTAQWFYGADERLSALIVMPKDTRRVQQLADQINQEIDQEWYVALTWQEMLADFLRMMKMDMAGNKMIIYILYVVIGFGLFGTILTMTLERLREFSMLIAIGMKRFQLMWVCFMESIMLSLIGVLAGVLLTFPFVWYFHVNPVMLTGEMADMMKDYGFEAVMPTSVEPSVFTSQALAIFLIAILISLYPVYKVYRLKVINPV